MPQWHKTGCVLCAQNCGLEVKVADNRMVKVRPDKDNPRSRGYACRKGLNVLHHQYPKDRITQPLKRVGDGFEPVSWEQAIEEINGAGGVLGKKVALVFEDTQGLPEKGTAAMERLVDSGESETIHSRYAGWCLELAETAEPEFRGPELEIWLNLMTGNMPKQERS